MVLIEARKRQVENEAIRLRWEIFNRRAEFWPGRQHHPLEVLDPNIAARALGFELEYLHELKFDLLKQSHEIAGILDRNRRKIFVAQCFGPEVETFTAAHELGHVVLHAEKVIMHRDLPIHGLDQKEKDPVEREANYFAGTFLMPTEFLTKVFKARFSAAPFVFTEDAANFLRPRDAASLLHPYPGSHARSVALASARSFAGRAFGNSLAEVFKVSVATMAIRLRELELVSDYP